MVKLSYDFILFGDMFSFEERNQNDGVWKCWRDLYATPTPHPHHTPPNLNKSKCRVVTGRHSCAKDKMILLMKSVYKEGIVFVSLR